ncbi:MAG: hypothetical protein EZS28_049704, partial [Streblomastix strix]
CGGVQLIFDVFRKSTSAPWKNSAAVSIDYLFKAREINDTKIRKDVIAHLKKLAYEKIDFKHKARRSLIFLELNPVNSQEIKKGGFKIPEWEQGEEFSDFDEEEEFYGQKILNID